MRKFLSIQRIREMNTPHYKYFTTTIIVFLVFMVLYIYLWPTKTNSILPEINCKGFTKADIELGDKMLDFSITETVQFFGDKRNIIQIEGYVTSDNEKTYLERVIYLSGIKYNKNNLYLFSVEKVDKSMLDSTPDYRFNQLWSELSGDDDSLSIEIKAIADNVNLIISPLAPQFSCVTH